jgi:hypothetical protein
MSQGPSGLCNHIWKTSCRTCGTNLKEWPDDAESIASLKALLADALGDLQWCGGADDFGPNGKAKIGYDAGPRRTIDRITKVLQQD